MKKRIAVVGGGIFGTTIAIKLVQKNTIVDLYEKENDILKATSSINEYRIHKGYHYPRSRETALSALKTESLFKKYYKEAIINSRNHYYAIAKNNSLTTKEEYLKFCDDLKLDYEKISLELLNQKAISLTIKVRESLFDPILLKKSVWEKLKKRKVNVLLNTKATPAITESYDFVIICTYANSNQMLKLNTSAQKKYQFEICEKPIVQLPESFFNKSIVIMDGPFMCIDPYRNTESDFVMGNVVHAIHNTNIGKYPKIPKVFNKLLNKGIVYNPSVTNIDKLINSGAEYMPELQKAKHIGSMYTVRAVLPHKDKTDERPTIVKRLNNKVITVFSGKISNCVEVADHVVEILNS